MMLQQAPAMEKNTEKKGKTKTLARYSRVSATAAGLAARVAGEKYLGLKIDRDDHARKMTAALGGLKGPLMKVGQILATIPEALPPEYAQAFQQLQADAPPMGWPFVRRRMAVELGPAWERKFTSFEKTAAAAASLGQVHKAVAHDGRLLACKLQYPDMESAIAADLNQLKFILGLYEAYDSALKTDRIQDELAQRLHEELDYDIEARHCNLYGYMLSGEKNIHVPEVIGDLSTRRLLTTTWLDGRRILEFSNASLDIRNRISLHLFRAWYVPLYGYGVIHGDPHPGNYTIRDDLGLNLLDYGCVRVFPPSFIGGVIDLYHGLARDDESLIVHAFETWGFSNLARSQIEALTLWARFLYAPVLEDKIRLIGETRGGVYGRETAQEVHRLLRDNSRHGNPVTVPREFVFMDRAALGLGSVFIRLRAEINWHRLFNEMIAGFDAAELEKKQKSALQKFRLPAAAPTDQNVRAQSAN